ncbi:hypothetical protein ACSSS7_006742 [Eimeria intestinalis]
MALAPFFPPDGVFDSPLWSWPASKREASQAVFLAVQSLSSASSPPPAQASRTRGSGVSDVLEEATLLSSRALPFFGSVRGLQVEIEQGPQRARVVFIVISLDDFLVPVWATPPAQDTGTKAKQYTVCWQHKLGILQPLVAMELFAIWSSLSGTRLADQHFKKPPVITRMIFAHEIQAALEQKRLKELIVTTAARCCAELH